LFGAISFARIFLLVGIRLMVGQRTLNP